jgi:hypothetical protein
MPLGKADNDNAIAPKKGTMRRAGLETWTFSSQGNLPPYIHNQLFC